VKLFVWGYLHHKQLFCKHILKHVLRGIAQLMLSKGHIKIPRKHVVLNKLLSHYSIGGVAK